MELKNSNRHQEVYSQVKTRKRDKNNNNVSNSEMAMKSATIRRDCLREINVADYSSIGG